MADFWKNINKPITALAPMDDVTDTVFRDILLRTARPKVFFTEFISIDALCSKGHVKAKRKLIYSEAQRPVVAQIWGNDPERFKQAAAFVKELGFDGIDINMGCPDRAVVKKGAGAALINKQDLVHKIITAVREGAPDITLSIKTRLDRKPELTKEWMSFLLSQDINALTLHARTAPELSKVPAHWDELGKVVELRNEINPAVTVIGNGDVKTYKEIVEKHKVYGVDGVMVGRGIFQDPWLFDKNENPTEHTIQEHLELLKQHTQHFYEVWGNSKHFEVLKKFAKVYVKDFKGANELRVALMETKSFDEFRNIVESLNK